MCQSSYRPTIANQVNNYISTKSLVFWDISEDLQLSDKMYELNLFQDISEAISLTIRLIGANDLIINQHATTFLMNVGYHSPKNKANKFFPNPIFQSYFSRRQSWPLEASKLCWISCRCWRISSTKSTIITMLLIWENESPQFRQDSLSAIHILNLKNVCR